MEDMTKQIQHIKIQFPLQQLTLPNFFSSKYVFDVIVFSHLRWQFVLQRPQHILTRLAKYHRVLFVEDPISSTDENRGTAHVMQIDKHIRVLQPHIDHTRLAEELTPLVEKYTKQFSFPVLWFYSPIFADMMRKISHSVVVYDCMDELSAFKGASPILREKETYLLSRADIVFTGGKSLYESKKKYNESVFCFPSSVDRKHFESVWKQKLPAPLDIKKIPRPRVGYYGVIDERIDTKLLAEIAENSSDISFVMIGPVVKIDPTELPHLPNIYYLGGKSYARLPHYLQQLDVTMMPFALNESTKFISPTKTLEFMAAKKPIVSTRITDVVRDYRHVVGIADSSPDFLGYINSYLHETPRLRKQREAFQSEVIARTSWDKTVKSMRQIIQAQLKQKFAWQTKHQERPLFAPYSLSRL